MVQRPFPLNQWLTFEWLILVHFELVCLFAFCRCDRLVCNVVGNNVFRAQWPKGEIKSADGTGSEDGFIGWKY